MFKWRVWCIDTAQFVTDALSWKLANARADALGDRYSVVEA